MAEKWQSLCCCMKEKGVEMTNSNGGRSLLRVAVLRGALLALDEMRKPTPNTDCEHVGLGKGMKDVSQNFTLK